MASLGDLVVSVGGDTTEFQSAMKGVTTTLDRTVSDAQSAFKQFDKIGETMTSLGATLSVAITAPLVAAGASAFKFSTDFNASMANVASLMPGNIARVQELKTSVQEMAIQVGKSTGDLATGLYQVVSAFGDSADSAKILDVNARAAAAGLATTKESIDLTSAVTKAYGDTSAAAVEQVSDLALLTVQLGQTTFPELAASIGKVAPVAEALKISQQELFAVFSTLSGVTGTAAEVSTQFRQALIGLEKPSKAMQDALEKIHFKTGEAALQTLGFKGTLDALLGAVGGNTNELVKLWGQTESWTAVAALATSQSATFEEKLAKLQNAAGATDLAFREQTQGINAVGFAWDQAKIKMEVLSQRLGDALAPAFTKILDAATPLIDVLAQAVNKFSQLPTPVQEAAIAIGGVAAALGPILLVGGQIVSAVGTIGTAFGSLSTSLGGVTGGFGLLQTGIIGAIGAVVALDFRKLIGELGETAEIFKPVIDSVKEFFGQIGQVVTALATAAGALAATAFEAAGLGGVWEVLKKAVSSIDWTMLLTPLRIIVSTLNEVNEALKYLTGRFPEMFKSADENLKKIQTANDAWARSQADAAMKVAAHSTAVTDQKQAFADVTKALSAHKSAADKSKDSTASHHGATSKLTDALKDAEKQLSEVRRAYQLHAASADDVKAAENKVRDALKALHPEWTRQVDATEAAKDGLVAYQNALDNLPPAIDIAEQAMKFMKLTMGGTIPLTTDLEIAYKNLGITMSGEFKKAADKAKEAYETIKNSSISTQPEIDEAWRKMTEAVKRHAEAVGDADTVAKLQKSLDAVKEKHQEVATKTKTIWDDLGTAIQNSLSSATSGIGELVVSGDWDKLTEKLKGIGNAFLDAFKTTAANAIQHLVDFGFKLLFEQLDKLLAKIPGVGGALGGIFGGSTGTGTSTPTGTPTSPTSTLGSASAGFQGIFGMVTGAVSAITGVIGVFQAARQEGTLNAIELNTRVTFTHLTFMLEEAFKYWPRIHEIRDYLYNIQDFFNNAIFNELHDINFQLQSRLTDLKHFFEDTQWTLFVTISSTLDAILADIRTFWGGQGESQVTKVSAVDLSAIGSGIDVIPRLLEKLVEVGNTALGVASEGFGKLNKNFESFFARISTVSVSSAPSASTGVAATISAATADNIAMMLWHLDTIAKRMAIIVTDEQAWVQAGKVFETKLLGGLDYIESQITQLTTVTRDGMERGIAAMTQGFNRTVTSLELISRTPQPVEVRPVFNFRVYLDGRELTNAQIRYMEEIGRFV
jgi:TP901 family phage tail tape measure protein